MIDLIRKFCLEEVKNDRSRDYIFTHLLDEVDELDVELELLHEGLPGPDGVFGESIDVILCAFDLIFKDNPDITNKEIEAYVLKKLQKWKAKYNAS